MEQTLLSDSAAGILLRQSLIDPGEAPTGKQTFETLNFAVRDQLPQIFKGSYIQELTNLSFGNPTYREERIVSVVYSRFGPCCLLCAPERTDQVRGLVLCSQFVIC